MKLLILCLFSIAAFGQAPSPISNTHILVYPAYGKLAEIKPDIQFVISFTKKEEYKEIVFHRTQYDTAAEYELLVTLKKKGVVTPPEIVETIVDDRNPLIKYTPAWVPYTGTVYHDGTAQYTTTVGASAMLIFTGNRVQYHAEKRFNHGIASVSVNRYEGTSTVPVMTYKVVDLYNPRRENVPELIFDSGLLPQGKYNIYIEMTGTKNTAASENNIVIDYLKYYSVK